MKVFRVEDRFAHMQKLLQLLLAHGRAEFYGVAFDDDIIYVKSKMPVPRTVAPFTRRDVLYLALSLVVLAAIVIVFDVHKTRVFEAMTPAQHLAEARSALVGPSSIDVAREHLSAIPPTSPEAAEATLVLKEVDARQKAFDDQDAADRAEKVAKDARQKEEIDTRSSRALLVQISLRDLGYDFAVSPSETAGEVVITSSEFDDTDHRVQFLAFLRSKKSPVLGLCFGGFARVRY